MMQPIDFIAHLIDGRTFDNVLGVHEYDTSHLVILKDKRVFQLVHNTPGHRILCEDWGDEILILDNSYMTSFLDNLALMALTLSVAGDHAFGKSVSELNGALAKKFFAEQLFILENSEMARVLFLETIIEYDEALRQAFEYKNANENVRRSSNFFTACAANFLRNHEFGHIVAQDEQYLNYIDHARQEAHRFESFHKQSTANQECIIQEISCDIFGINIVMGLYASSMSGLSLRNYLTFLTIGVVRMHVLYDLAADAHRNNVDQNFDIGNIDDRFVEWQIRERVMLSYIEEFAFGSDTVAPLESDDLVHLDIYASGLVDITSRDFSAKPSENIRRLASLISSGFAPGASFSDIIASTRPTRVLDRPE